MAAMVLVVGLFIMLAAFVRGVVKRLVRHLLRQIIPGFSRMTRAFCTPVRPLRLQGTDALYPDYFTIIQKVRFFSSRIFLIQFKKALDNS
jgi:hypothetical protein